MQLHPPIIEINSVKQNECDVSKIPNSKAREVELLYVVMPPSLVWHSYIF